MQIHLFDQLEGIDPRLVADSRLDEAATLPMQQWSWIRAGAATFGRQGQLRIVVGVDGDRAVAVVPLVRHPQNNYFEFLAVPQLYEPTDVLCSNPEALAPLAEALVHQGMPFLLQRLPAESALAGPLKQAMEGQGLFVNRPDVGWPTLSLDSRWEEPESQLNAGRRSDLRRARRRAEALGPITVEVLAPSPDELPSLLDEAYAVEAASWKGAAGSALAHEPVMGAFYRHYAEATSRQGRFRLAFLSIGNQRAAMQMAVECANRFWLLKTGYDAQFARCSPGLLLVNETVREAARRGLESYEFLGAPEEWTQVWTRVERPCLALHGYPLNLRGLSAFTDRVVKSTWRRVLTRP